MRRNKFPCCLFFAVPGCREGLDQKSFAPLLNFCVITDIDFSGSFMYHRYNV